MVHIKLPLYRLYSDVKKNEILFTKDKLFNDLVEHTYISYS